MLLLPTIPIYAARPISYRARGDTPWQPRFPRWRPDLTPSQGKLLNALVKERRREMSEGPGHAESGQAGRFSCQIKALTPKLGVTE